MLLFYAALALVFLLIITLFKRAGVAKPYSSLMLIATLFSVISTVCLAENYIQSLVPGIQDGISVSNPLAYYWIGDDRWTHAKFQAAFEYGVLASVLCLTAYIAATILESR